MIEFPRDAQQVLANALGAPVKVLGVGGAGCNVVDRMAMEGMDEAELVTLNTDSRALMNGVTPHRVQLGTKLTRGLGAGGDPEIGQSAAMESQEEIRAVVQNQKLVFICAGLGGGTGSGAAPEVARIARESGAMVITFATLPFGFEGKRRVKQAEEALQVLRSNSDAVIVFENDRMGEVALATEGVQKAFEAADRLVGRSIKGVAAIVAKPGLIRVGLDDLLAVLRPSAGHCLFGHGQGDGENRAKEALDRALKSPLLNKGKMLEQASAVLVHVTGGEDLRLFEVQTLMRELGKHVSERAQIFFGMAVDPAMKKSLEVTVFSPLANEDGPGEEPPVSVKMATNVPAPQAAEAAPTPASSPAAATPAPEPADSLFAPLEFTSLELIPADEPVAPEEFPAAEETVGLVESAADEVVDLAGEESPSDDGEVPWQEDAPALAEEPDFYQSPPSESEESATPPAEDEPLETVIDQEVLGAPLHSRRVVLPLPRGLNKPAEETEESSPTGRSTQARLAQTLRAPSKEMEEIVAPADTSGQRELQLGARHDGGRFDKAEPTLIDGEDLDLPAYLRKRRKS